MISFTDDGGFGILFAHLFSKARKLPADRIELHLVKSSKISEIQIQKEAMKMKDFLVKARIEAESHIIKVMNKSERRKTSVTIEKDFRNLVKSKALKFEKSLNDLRQNFSNQQTNFTSDDNQNSDRVLEEIEIQKMEFAIAANILIKNTLANSEFNSRLVIMSLPDFKSEMISTVYYDYVLALTRGIKNVLLVQSQESHISFDL